MACIHALRRCILVSVVELFLPVIFVVSCALPVVPILLGRMARVPRERGRAEFWFPIFTACAFPLGFAADKSGILFTSLTGIVGGALAPFIGSMIFVTLVLAGYLLGRRVVTHGSLAVRRNARSIGRTFE